MKALKMLLLLLAGSTAAQTQGLKDSKGVYTYVDRMPEFAGNVNSYLASNIKYPEQARKENVQGRTVIKFVVDEQGKVQNAIVEKATNPVLDAEALRVVQAMPAWRPGALKGKPVKVYYRIPIMFTLDSEKSKG